MYYLSSHTGHLYLDSAVWQTPHSGAILLARLSCFARSHCQSKILTCFEVSLVIAVQRS